MQFIPAALAAVGSIYQGQVAGEEARAAATNASNTADLARRQAAIREERIRQANALRLGEQRASAAQSGFDPNTGSLLLLQGDSASEAEYEALNARYEGVLQSLSLENEASMHRARGKSARRTGYLNASGVVLGAAGRPYGSSPGFSGTQLPAPVESRTFTKVR